MKWMKSGAQVLFVLALVGILATSALACPLWMSQGDMPCSKPGNPEKCPTSICQLSSPYLTTYVAAQLTPLRDLGPITVDSPHALMPIAFRSPELNRTDDGPPPGPATPLFLLTESLLI